jgi:hypothetical protein
VTEYMLPPSRLAPNGQHVVRRWNSPATSDEWDFTGTDAVLTTEQIVALYALIDPVIREALLGSTPHGKRRVETQARRELLDGAERRKSVRHAAFDQTRRAGLRLGRQVSPGPLDPSASSRPVAPHREDLGEVAKDAERAEDGEHVDDDQCHTPAPPKRREKMPAGD